MASFPHPGSVTVCEINRDLITAQNLSDERAQETYGKVLGMVFSPVSFDSTPSSLQENEGQENGDKASGESKGLVATLQMKVADSLKQILQPTDVTLLSEIDLQGVSWHQGKHIIAFISGANQVTIRDYEDKGLFYLFNSGFLVHICRCVHTVSYSSFEQMRKNLAF
jgi:aladin